MRIEYQDALSVQLSTYYEGSFMTTSKKNSIVILNNKSHIKLKIKNDKSYEHAKEHHLAYLLVHEFPKAVLDFPIVFIKDADTGQFKSVALFGFKPGENLFYDKKGWHCKYVPANVRRHPFLMVPKNEDLTEWDVCIDEASSLLSESEGNSLFDTEGKASQHLEEAKQFLIDVIEKEQLTSSFCNYLAAKDLFRANSITVSNSDGQKTAVNGLYIIDEDKLNDLSDDEYLDLKKRGCMGPIYSHLSSLGQINNLLQLHNK